MLLPSPRTTRALLAAPLWGLAVRLHYVVPPYSGGRQTARNPFVRTSVPHSYASFLPQALLPEEIQKQKAIKLTAFIKINI
jgi:hypothetical protein